MKAKITIQQFIYIINCNIVFVEGEIRTHAGFFPSELKSNALTARPPRPSKNREIKMVL